MDLASAVLQLEDTVDVAPQRLAPVVGEPVGVGKLAHRLEQRVQPQLDPADLVGVGCDAEINREDRRVRRAKCTNRSTTSGSITVR
jgi:hypothetical protein